MSVQQLETKIGKLMTQDATILAAVQAMEADLTQAATVLTSLQATVAALQAEVAAGGTSSISDATMTELANAKAQADAFLAAETAAVPTTGTTPPATS
jgi:predicted  nucleic acid-binding Zn-ribbon protein